MFAQLLGLYPAVVVVITDEVVDATVMNVVLANVEIVGVDNNVDDD